MAQGLCGHLDPDQVGAEKLWLSHPRDLTCPRAQPNYEISLFSFLVVSDVRFPENPVCVWLQNGGAHRSLIVDHSGL